MMEQLTTAELELTRRELRASLGLLTPGSPAHVPVLAHMRPSTPSLPDVPAASTAARATARQHDTSRAAPPTRRAGTPTDGPPARGT